MDGYLTPRPTPPNYFEFIPAYRPVFDTRGPSTCTASGDCTVTQTLGPETSTTTIPDHRAGFLVTAFDRHDLKKLGAERFLTNTELEFNQYQYNAEQTEAMAAFIEKWGAAGAIVMVTSRHAKQQEWSHFYSPGTRQPTWEKLEGAIASIGGSRDSFNRAAEAEGGTYSTVGWKGLAEGEAAETWGSGEGGGRLRGSFVQGRNSRFITTNVSSDGPAIEGLTRLALAPPSGEKWPLSGDLGAERAISYIGSAVNELGPNPRASYVEQKITEATDSDIVRELEHVRYPGGSEFTEAQFTAAREELLKEVFDVAKVRTYLEELARPAEKAGESSWAEADDLETRLKVQLEILKREGKVKWNYYSFIQALFQVIPLLKKFPEGLKPFMSLAASVSNVSGQMYGTDWAGSPTGQNEILAADLADELKRSSELDAEGLWGIGNIVISDPKKLFELGAHAKCAPDQCGKEYADFAYTADMAELAKAAVLRARDRTIYETLVPASYPIWDTGFAYNPDPTHETDSGHEWFYCRLHDVWLPTTSPFNGADELAYAKVLDRLDPDGHDMWLTYLSVAHDRSYGWAPKSILERMFDPIPDNVDASSGGLGIEAGAFMRKAHRNYPYEPGTDCRWGTEL